MISVAAPLPTGAIVDLWAAAEPPFPRAVASIFDGVRSAAASGNAAELDKVFRRAPRGDLICFARWLLAKATVEHFTKAGAYWALTQWLDAVEVMLNREVTASAAFRFAREFAKVKVTCKSRRALQQARRRALLSAREGKIGRPRSMSFSVFHDAAIWAEYLHQQRSVRSAAATRALAEATGLQIDSRAVERERAVLRQWLQMDGRANKKNFSIAVQHVRIKHLTRQRIRIRRLSAPNV